MDFGQAKAVKRTLISGIVLTLVAGCAPAGGKGWWLNDPNLTVSQAPGPNPVSVVIGNHEFAWSQIVDEVDNYFKIRKEERLRIEEGIVSEGVITTYPTPGSTLSEPWKKDSTPGFEKLQSTLHSVRRSCKVRVIPSGTSYLVEIEVTKEMEDLPNPENATVGHTIRSNIATRFDEDGVDGDLPKARWYVIGRDVSLEQKMLANIQSRLQVQ